jgi:hypothetical protein
LAREESARDPAALRALGASVLARIAAMLSGARPADVGTPCLSDEPAADALRQLDQALAMLSERLADNVLDGFAVE